MLLLIDAGLLALAGIITYFLIRAGREARRRAEADAAAKLAAVGLQANGDLLGKFIARPFEGVDVLITNRASQTRPGATEPTDATCVARVAVPLTDQIVCKSGEVDLVMGPLPAVPRIRTSHPRFDDAYTVFVGSAGGAPSGSYRAAPMASDIPWAQGSILDRLLELELLWMRVQEGRAELVFPALEVEDIGRAAALALAVEHAARGRPAPALAAGPRTIRPRFEVSETVVTVWLGGALAGLLGGLIVCAIVDELVRGGAAEPNWAGGMLAGALFVLLGLGLTAMHLRKRGGLGAR